MVVADGLGSGCGGAEPLMAATNGLVHEPQVLAAACDFSPHDRQLLNGAPGGKARHGSVTAFAVAGLVGELTGSAEAVDWAGLLLASDSVGLTGVHVATPAPLLGPDLSVPLAVSFAAAAAFVAVLSADGDSIIGLGCDAACVFWL